MNAKKTTDTKIVDKNNTRTATITIAGLHVPKTFNIRSNPAEDDKEIKELQKSIKEAGLLSSITVRETKPNQYSLVCGFRRLQAVKNLGWQTIDAIVMPPNTTDEEAFIANAVENIQRKNVTSYDLAVRCAMLRKEYKMTGDAIAAKFGKSKSDVNNLISCVEKLDPKILDLWKKSSLGTGMESAGDTKESAKLAGDKLSERGRQGITMMDLYRLKGLGHKEQMSFYESLIRSGGKENGAGKKGAQTPEKKAMMTRAQCVETLAILSFDEIHDVQWKNGFTDAMKLVMADINRYPLAAAKKAWEENAQKEKDAEKAKKAAEKAAEKEKADKKKAAEKEAAEKSSKK